MPKDPAVLLYTSDFLTGTAFFTDAERGQYIRLLCEQHQIGHIPENHMVTVCLSLASPVVKKFTRDENGFYFNARMDEEIRKRLEFTESRRKNGEKGGRPKDQNKPLGKPVALATENLGDNENDNEDLIGIKGGIRGDFIGKIIDVFAEEYEFINQIQYAQMTKGKERAAAGKILKLHKNKNPNMTSDETLESLKLYFKRCVSIQDDWLRTNMSLSIIVSKFNEINNKLKNGSKRTVNGNGVTDAELAGIVASKFATDRPE